MVAQSIYDFSAEKLEGGTQPFSDYKGKVLLIVNTASKCGFTPQYEGLEQLYQQFKNQDFMVLGFPCNQFGHQEPGGSDEIASFCQRNYGVNFPMFAKIDVNGSNTHPLYRYLKSEAKGAIVSAIKWNFTKFLVDKQGNVVKRYGPMTTPSQLISDIRALL